MPHPILHFRTSHAIAIALFGIAFAPASAGKGFFTISPNSCPPSSSPVRATIKEIEAPTSANASSMAAPLLGCTTRGATATILSIGTTSILPQKCMSPSKCPSVL